MVFFSLLDCQGLSVVPPAGYRDRGPIGIQPLISIIIIRLVLDKALHTFPSTSTHLGTLCILHFSYFFFSGASRWTKHKSHHKRHGTSEYWHYLFFMYIDISIGIRNWAKQAALLEFLASLKLGLLSLKLLKD